MPEWLGTLVMGLLIIACLFAYGAHVLTRPDAAKRPTIAHIITSPGQAKRALAAGATGLMVSSPSKVHP